MQGFIIPQVGEIYLPHLQDDQSAGSLYVIPCKRLRGHILAGDCRTERPGDDIWCSYTNFLRLIWVRAHELHIPVFPLEDELMGYKSKGQVEKAALIRQMSQPLRMFS
jgi:hypothetical protein